MEDKPRLHVLVVDDHPDMARRLSEMVERAGFRTSFASGGREGIAVFHAAQSAGVPFVVVITDFSMPDLDGLALAAVVKGVSVTTAVILLTAYSSDTDGQLPPNVDAILAKPPSADELRSTLARLTTHI
jgi:CheY-like chemotaxis protein